MNPTTPDPLTATEMYESLSGFDEIAVRKAFGANITDFASKGAQRNPMMFARALVFVAKRREGAKDAEAYAAAMTLPNRDLSGYFADEPDEPEDGADAADLDDEDGDWGKAPTT